MYLSYDFCSITKAAWASFKFAHVSNTPIREPDRIRTGETSLLQRPGLSHLPTDSMAWAGYAPANADFQSGVFLTRLPSQILS